MRIAVWVLWKVGSEIEISMQKGIWVVLLGSASKRERKALGGAKGEVYTTTSKQRLQLTTWGTLELG